jgi:hypothetical protein
VTSRARLKNILDLQNFNKIINDKKDYAIIFFSSDSIDTINEFKYDLLLENIFCVKIKNSIYRILQLPLLVDKFGELNGANYIVFSYENTQINYEKLIAVLDNCKQIAIFTFGRHHNILYDESRLIRLKGTDQSVARINALLKPSFSFLSSLLGMQQKQFFNKFIYILHFGITLKKIYII